MSPSPESDGPNPRPFLTFPDVIRERIYYFTLVVEEGDPLDEWDPWITPLPPSRRIPKHLPGLPPKPDSTLENVSKRVRKKRRRRLRAWEQRKRDITTQAQGAAASPRSLALLQTCRTILLEAFHIWYRYNTLNFCHSDDLYDFLVAIGRARANEIRNIRLDLPSSEWDYSFKAKYALEGLVRLQSLTFIYNDMFSSYRGLYSIHNIGYPKIISQLRGLKEVNFKDPETEDGERRLWEARGYKMGMSEGVRMRMEELGGRMIGKRKKPKNGPPMVDLFNRVKLRDQKRNDNAGLRWNEDFAYAPEVIGDH
ncbi:MAG: hypothetical protein LQ346_005105 [Caloplaca aetnensis]|nr:MAG: hypothetical protein LQ346_005105 [Caloplaca aetnensis]